MERAQTGSSVSVVGSDDEVEQPVGFRCCPLGVQYYSTSPMEEFSTLEMDIQVPDEKGTTEKITCHGAVVHCERPDEESLYRIWVLFVDLDKDVRSRLECVSSEKALRCEHCMNF